MSDQVHTLRDLVARVVTRLGLVVQAGYVLIVPDVQYPSRTLAFGVGECRSEADSERRWQMLQRLVQAGYEIQAAVDGEGGWGVGIGFPDNVSRIEAESHLRAILREHGYSPNDSVSDSPSL